MHFQETYYNGNAANILDSLDEMDKFLETNKLLKAIQEETENLKETVKTSQKEKPRPIRLTPRMQGLFNIKIYQCNTPY